MCACLACLCLCLPFAFPFRCCPPLTLPAMPLPLPATFHHHHHHPHPTLPSTFACFYTLPIYSQALLPYHHTAPPHAPYHEIPLLPFLGIPIMWLIGWALALWHGWGWHGWHGVAGSFSPVFLPLPSLPFPYTTCRLLSFPTLPTLLLK